MGSGCPGRAIVTTKVMVPATARETEGQAALQHNKARRMRQPVLVMVAHTETNIRIFLRLPHYLKCFTV